MLPCSVWNPENNHQWDLCIRSVLFGISWFDEWFDTLKEMSSYVREDSRRLVMRVELQKEPGDTSHKVLLTMPTSPFKLRWGTVIDCTKDMNEL